MGKKKAELKKSMLALMPNDPVDAHTGLGIIYVYENLYELALKEFRSAFIKSKGGFHQTIHLANYLFILGQYDEAINLYLSLKKSLNKEVFLDITHRLTSYCFENELKALFENSNFSNNLSKDIESAILEMNAVIGFLKKHDIPLGFYREVLNAQNRVFYKHYSLPTVTDITSYHDWNFQTLGYSLDLDIESIGENYELIANMNDDLQDMLINVYTVHKISLGSDQDRITVYFKLADEVAA